MNQELILQKTKEFVKQKLEGEGTGHDWWHIERVLQNALRIGQEENVDLFVVELGALLHDIADWKFSEGDELAGSRVAAEWLRSLEVPEEIVLRVSEIIEHLSFKGAGVATHMPSREGMVVQDADRLDALGAIGIARCFAYGGHKGRPLYDPNLKPELHKTFERYKHAPGTSLNHFYEKLLLLKDRMNTETAKRMATERHVFVEKFLNQFLCEWNGNA